MGNCRPFLQGPLPVANYTRIIIPGRFWTRPPSTKSTRMASSATPLHDSLIELAIPDAHAHAIKWYLKVHIPLDVVQVYPVSIPVSYARVPNRQALSRRLQDVESLPEGWTVANSSSCTTLYKVICNSEPPLVTTDSLVVHDDLTWTLTIASTQVLPPHIPVVPSTLHCLQNIMDILTVVDGLCW